MERTLRGPDSVSKQRGGLSGHGHKRQIRDTGWCPRASPGIRCLCSRCMEPSGAPDTRPLDSVEQAPGSLRTPPASHSCWSSCTLLTGSPRDRLVQVSAGRHPRALSTLARAVHPPSTGGGSGPTGDPGEGGWGLSFLTPSPRLCTGALVCSERPEGRQRPPHGPQHALASKTLMPPLSPGRLLCQRAQGGDVGSKCVHGSQGSASARPGWWVGRPRKGRHRAQAQCGSPKPRHRGGTSERDFRNSK